MEAKQKQMTQKDRQELRRILKARFEILGEQILQRKKEIQEELRERIEADHAQAVKTASRKTQAILTKAQKLADEARELQEEMADLGVVPTTSRHYARYYDDGKLFDFQVAESWTPANLQKKIDAAFRELSNQAGLHNLDLRMKELELSEELAIGALGSEEAHSFLARIPNIDTLLPLNGNVSKVLEKGAIEGEATEVES